MAKKTATEAPVENLLALSLRDRLGLDKDQMDVINIKVGVAQACNRAKTALLGAKVSVDNANQKVADLAKGSAEDYDLAKFAQATLEAEEKGRLLAAMEARFEVDFPKVELYDVVG